ncbi:MAG: septal ring lytic transglycosylase RlpA family protein [Bacteroidota bacterium]
MRPLAPYLLIISLAAIAEYSFNGCAVAPRFATKPSPLVPGKEAVVAVQEGIASYYADEFNGKKTSSGETYDMYSFTAAHRELPFGTKVRVTNLENGRSVIVRINDRGPFMKDRIIDLSFAAGKQIGLIANGTARVKLEVLQWGPTEKDSLVAPRK